VTQHEILTQVRVRRRKWVPSRFAHPLAGEVGVVVGIETGKYSKKLLYSVVFETKGVPKAECFFENQLESVEQSRKVD
jgi:hypothetical protein